MGMVWSMALYLRGANGGTPWLLPIIVVTMLGSEESWEAMLDFFEYTISQKEARERERESSPLSVPIRRH